MLKSQSKSTAIHTTRSPTTYTIKSHLKTTPKRTNFTTKKTKSYTTTHLITKPSTPSTIDTTNPLNLIHKRQLHPVHVYGSNERPIPQFERAPLPAEPLILAEYAPSHIQYISGYQFIPISNVRQVKKTLLSSLSKFEVLGRIYMNEQGINLQMCSHPSKTEQIINTMRSLENGLFKTTRIFANDIVDTTTVPPLFDKLVVLERQILNDGLSHEYSSKLTQYIEQINHLDPNEWHQALLNAETVTDLQDKPIILDIRNLYENEVGAFKNSIAVDVDAYRDTFHILDTLLSIKHPEGKEPYAEDMNTTNKHQDADIIQRTKPQRGDLHRITKNNHQFEQIHQQQTLQVGEKLRKLHGTTETNTLLNSSQFEISQLTSSQEDESDRSIVGINKKQKIMIFCTGGIRCLKVGAYLKQQGFEDINTLNGGVNAYSVFAQNNLSQEESMFDGSNVVFDHRRAVKVGQKVLSLCHQCGTPSDIQRNCSNELCDILHIQCQECETFYNGTCSIQCSEEKFGLGDWTRQMLKTRQIRSIATPPSKTRIRPRIQPYSITQHASYLDDIAIINSDLEQPQDLHPV